MAPWQEGAFIGAAFFVAFLLIAAAGEKQDTAPSSKDATDKSPRQSKKE